jgi:hypothetical protein
MQLNMKLAGSSTHLFEILKLHLNSIVGGSEGHEPVWMGVYGNSIVYLILLLTEISKI